MWRSRRLSCAHYTREIIIWRNGTKPAATDKAKTSRLAVENRVFSQKIRIKHKQIPHEQDEEIFLRARKKEANRPLVR